VKKIKGTWTVVGHHNRRRRMEAIGPSDGDRKRAEEIAGKVNAKITLGTFGLGSPDDEAISCKSELEKWIATHGPTLKPTTKLLFEGFIRNHLGPHFGS